MAARDTYPLAAVEAGYDLLTGIMGGENRDSEKAAI